MHGTVGGRSKRRAIFSSVSHASAQQRARAGGLARQHTRQRRPSACCELRRTANFSAMGTLKASLGLAQRHNRSFDLPGQYIFYKGPEAWAFVEIFTVTARNTWSCMKRTRRASYGAEICFISAVSRRRRARSTTTGRRCLKGSRRRMQHQVLRTHAPGGFEAARRGSGTGGSRPSTLHVHSGSGAAAPPARAWQWPGCTGAALRRLSGQRRLLQAGPSRRGTSPSGADVAAHHGRARQRLATPTRRPAERARRRRTRSHRGRSAAWARRKGEMSAAADRG